MDTFLIEEANKDFVGIYMYFVSSEKLLRKFNIKIMVMKRNLLFDKMLTAFLHISKF